MPHSSKKNNHTDSIPPFLQNPTPSYDPPPLQQFFHPPFPGIFGKVNLPFKKRGVGGEVGSNYAPPKAPAAFYTPTVCGKTFGLSFSIPSILLQICFMALEWQHEYGLLSLQNPFVFYLSSKV